MKITLLLDLDDTLLNTNMQEFAPAYFSSLSSALADEVSPDIMIPALVGGTKAMMKNVDPGITLREVFNQYFFSRLKIPREALQEKIDRFYDLEFPKLKHVSSQRPDAIEFVNWAFDAGHRVAVATNPLFPRKAILHRLSWAGLSAENHPFALISSYETFHFTKEISSYFPEFLAQMGWPDDPVVMVGNDPDMDLLPAMNAGIPVYWFKESPDGNHNDIPQGTFANLRLWLENIQPESLIPAFSSAIAVVNLLRSSPAALGTITASIMGDKWRQTSTADDWSPTEILCHLRDVEKEINIPRVKSILTTNNIFIPGVASDQWASERYYAQQDGRQAYQAFLEARKELVALLSEGQIPWDRRVRHAIFGPTTLLELTKFMAEHDRIHIQQLTRAISNGRK